MNTSSVYNDKSSALSKTMKMSKKVKVIAEKHIHFSKLYLGYNNSGVTVTIVVFLTL